MVTTATEPACLISGLWRVGGGEALNSLNPTTGEVVMAFNMASADDVEEAVRSAREALPRWSSEPPLHRQSLLLELARAIDAQQDVLVESVINEVGKPRSEAREEVRRAIAILVYHAGAILDPDGVTLPSPTGGGFAFTQTEPLGVVGLITPWNFPLAIPMWKLAPALAYGNTVVLKPSPEATATARSITRIAAELLPPGVLNVVAGGAESGMSLASASVNGLSFTGSTPAGLALARQVAGFGVRFQAELGGKNASIVLKDADLERTAVVVARAAMGFAGQKCTATSRVIVDSQVAASFTDLLADAIAALRVGLPSADETEVGPMISPAAVARVSEVVRRGTSDGAEPLVGGVPRGDLGTAFFAPTLFSKVSAESELASAEIFGPVLSLLVADDEADALRLANSTQYGLAAAVFTRDIDLGLRFARKLDAGLIRVNGPTPGVLFNAPFAPRKASGIGLPEQGKTARDFFTLERTIDIVSDHDI